MAQAELKGRVIRDVKFLIRSIETAVPGCKTGPEAVMYEHLLAECRGWWKVLMEGEDSNCEVVKTGADQEC